MSGARYICLKNPVICLLFSKLQLLRTWSFQWFSKPIALSGLCCVVKIIISDEMITTQHFIKYSMLKPLEMHNYCLLARVYRSHWTKIKAYNHIKEYLVNYLKILTYGQASSFLFFFLNQSVLGTMLVCLLSYITAIIPLGWENLGSRN